MNADDPVIPVDPQDPAQRRRRNQQDGARGGKPFKFGQKGDVREVAVNVPPDEPPPWQFGDTHAVVGQRTPRVDAVAKVTGKARYAYDMNLPGMVWAAFVRCPHARAKVTAVDYSEALKIPGVLVAKDYGSKDIRYALQHFGVVAAETHAACLEAVRAVKATFEVLPHAARMDQALAPDAPRVHSERPNKTGDDFRPEAVAAFEKAAQGCDAVVTGTATTEVQTHMCLEPHGVTARFEAPDRATVWASTQATFGARGEVARVLKVPEANVTVIAHYMGGGFGSKFSLGVAGAAACTLSKELGRPVKLMLERRAEHAQGGNRPSSVQEMSLGVKKDGTLAAYKVSKTGTGGIGGGAGAANPMIYDFGEVAEADFEVATNAGAAAAMRAPRHPQGSFALETIMNLAAEAIGMDPLELRRKNDKHPIRARQYVEGAKRFGWDKRTASGSGKGPIKKGMGVASSLWYALGGRGAQVLCRIRKDGSVEIRNGAQDIGVGTKTILAMVAAEELGIPLSRVTPFLGDTNDPIGPASGGSTTAPTIMPAARTAAFMAGRSLREIVAKTWDCGADDLALGGGKVIHLKDRSKSMAFEKACALMPGDEIAELGKRTGNYAAYEGQTGGVHFAEVEVDTEDGTIAVTRYLALQDAGTILNPLTAESQVNGAIVQGVSYALFEERILDRQLGQQVNADMEMYKIAGPKDMPRAEVILTEVVNGANNVGVAGLGEGPSVPVAAAIAGAVHNALGFPVWSLPMTPDRVLAAIAAKEKGK